MAARYSIQKRVGLATGAAAFFVALLNGVYFAVYLHGHAAQIVTSSYVLPLLGASVFMLATAFWNSRVSRIVHVLVFFGTAVLSAALNGPGDLNGVILYVLGLYLCLEYGLIGKRFRSQIIGAMVLYGLFSLASAGYLSKRPVLTGLENFAAAALFLYLFWVLFAEQIRNKRANEQLLLESEARFQAVIKNSSILAAIQDRDLRYTWVYNSDVLFPNTVVVGKTDDELFSAEDAGRLCALKTSVIVSGTGVQEELRATIGGHTLLFDLAVEPLRDTSDRIYGITVAAKNVTERALLRDRLVQSERFAAAGQLATYIAHEINSPLQGIASLLGYLRATADNGSEIRASLELMNAAFHSIRDTVQRLLDLNRPSSGGMEVVDLNEIVRSTFALTGTMLRRHRIKEELLLCDERPSVKAPTYQLTHLLLNLINNTLEAMERGQSVERNIWVRTERTDANIILRFADSGPGLSGATLAHLFDPFYTERRPIGMGIGLAICLKIARDLGGDITAGNSPGGGASFVVVLPRHDDRAARPSPNAS